jgi:hypothetical protein
MLSKAQAVKEWETSLKVLAEIQAHAAAHPNQPTTPSHLTNKLSMSGVSLSRELASPVATWKQLLKKQVGT